MVLKKRHQTLPPPGLETSPFAWSLESHPPNTELLNPTKFRRLVAVIPRMKPKNVPSSGGSMYDIFTYSFHKFKPNACNYTIHGSYGISECPKFVPPYIYLGVFDMAHEGMGNIPYTSWQFCEFVPFLGWWVYVILNSKVGIVTSNDWASKGYESPCKGLVYLEDHHS